MDDDFSERVRVDVKTVVVGENLSSMSEKDLLERVEALEIEIQHTKHEISLRSNTRRKAEQLFK
ncbi:DUF1192 family protein [Roseibium algae]|uniref:DUF1192 family protein n=1 Tax=Roseibium algae TaxID=3123038 RepID=A0ABU8TGS9_9HYPH